VVVVWLTHRAGPFGSPNTFETTDADGTIFKVTLPDTKSDTKVPLVVFMHGSTGQWEFYSDNLELMASHGAAVVFPFIKSPDDDKHFWVTNTDGTYLIKAIEYARAAAQDEGSALYGRVDLDNIIIAGHSMGATCSINASLKLKDDPAVKLTLTMHPGICGP
jgi:dipeptidyl aminopeptidase/acylaminoacyl peptidase